MNEEHSLAYELLVELKSTCRRWFIAFLVMVVLEVGTIAGFMWYISLPAEESSQTIEQETGNGGDNTGVIGGDLNNGKADDNSQDKKESSTQ